MKNSKKAVVKEQKKAAQKELTNQITGALQSVIANFEISSKRIEKLIDKNAKQLVKKLSKQKLSKPAPVKAETTKTPEILAVAKTVTAVKKVAKPKL